MANFTIDVTPQLENAINKAIEVAANEELDAAIKRIEDRRAIILMNAVTMVKKDFSVQTLGETITFLIKLV